MGKECSVAFVNPYRRWGVRAFFFFLLFLSNQTELERFLTFSVLWPRICNNDLGFRYSMKLVFFLFFAEESVGNLLRQLPQLQHCCTFLDKRDFGFSTFPTLSRQPNSAASFSDYCFLKWVCVYVDS